MNLDEYLITCLNEEGVEVAQICDKINRFGINDVNVLNPNGPTNRFRLVEELNDLKAVVEMMIDAGIIPANWEIAELKTKKREKVEKFMLYSRSMGTLK